jgi:hypothetical protein
MARITVPLQSAVTRSLIRQGGRGTAPQWHDSAPAQHRRVAGWYESSWDLARGLEVVELAAAEATGPADGSETPPEREG